VCDRTSAHERTQAGQEDFDWRHRNSPRTEAPNLWPRLLWRRSARYTRCSRGSWDTRTVATEATCESHRSGTQTLVAESGKFIDANMSMRHLECLHSTYLNASGVSCPMESVGFIQACLLLMYSFCGTVERSAVLDNNTRKKNTHRSSHHLTSLRTSSRISTLHKRDTAKSNIHCK
jgi:hypothetical protein